MDNGEILHTPSIRQNNCSRNAIVLIIEGKIILLQNFFFDLDRIGLVWVARQSESYTSVARKGGYD